jgi:drug/metabolite transporter (DMT)-like permease
VYFVVSSHSDDRLPPIAMAWSGLVVGAIVLLVAGAVGLVPMHANTGDVVFAGHRTSWVVPILGLSLVAAVIAYAAGIGAARRLGARLASFVGLAEVLFAVLFAWAFLGQRPSIEQAIGGVIVLAGIALVHADERLSAVPSAPEPALRLSAPDPSPA